MPNAILDIESSGLGPQSWPISIAWHVLETGREVHLLIRPSPNWHGWQAEAEAIHGLSRAQLERDGLPAAEVASRIIGELWGIDVFSDAPSLDQPWLDLVFAEAPGLHPPALRRIGDLFPGASRPAITDALNRVGEQTAPYKSIADVRKLVAAVTAYRGETG